MMASRRENGRHLLLAASVLGLLASSTALAGCDCNGDSGPSDSAGYSTGDGVVDLTGDDTPLDLSGDSTDDPTDESTTDVTVDSVVDSTEDLAGEPSVDDLPVDLSAEPTADLQLDTVSDTSVDQDVATVEPECAPPTVISTPSVQLVQPGALEYVGAFRPPSGTEAPPCPCWDYPASCADPGYDWVEAEHGECRGFTYAFESIAYRPNGDPASTDAYPGSLFITGHSMWNWVAEISIPEPGTSADPNLLPEAGIVQPLSDVRGGLFDTLAEQPRIGLAYLGASGGSRPTEQLYLAWGQHFQDADVGAEIPSHAWCDVTLATPNTQGAWWVGNETLYSVNGYMFPIPEAWATSHVGGRALATGRTRDGGWSGMGPSLHAIGPWLDGSPPAADAHLSVVPLIRYSDTMDDELSCSMLGWDQTDEWEGGSWITTADGRSAVVFVGTKGSGWTWYGYINPDESGDACAEWHGIGYDPSVDCFDPSGEPCDLSVTANCQYDPTDLVEDSVCATCDLIPWDEETEVSYDVCDAGETPCTCPQDCNEGRGWWSSRFDAQLIFYDPAQLEAVAAGDWSPHHPQPYASIDIDEQMYLSAHPGNPNIGHGDQRRFRMSEMAFDRERGLLYVMEREAAGDPAVVPVIHIWRIN